MNSRDDFYVILPSNSPGDGNQTSRYTVRLPDTVELDSSWTVALSSIMYPISFVAMGSEEPAWVTIHYENRRKNRVYLPAVSYSGTKDLEIGLNSYFNQVISYHEDDDLYKITNPTGNPVNSRQKRELSETIIHSVNLGGDKNLKIVLTSAGHIYGQIGTDRTNVLTATSTPKDALAYNWTLLRRHIDKSSNKPIEIYRAERGIIYIKSEVSNYIFQPTLQNLPSQQDAQDLPKNTNELIHSLTLKNGDKLKIILTKEGLLEAHIGEGVENLLYGTTTDKATFGGLWTLQKSHIDARTGSIGIYTSDKNIVYVETSKMGNFVYTPQLEELPKIEEVVEKVKTDKTISNPDPKKQEGKTDNTVSQPDPKKEDTSAESDFIEKLNPSKEEKFGDAEDKVIFSLRLKNGNDLKIFTTPQGNVGGRLGDLRGPKTELVGTSTDKSLIANDWNLAKHYVHPNTDVTIDIFTSGSGVVYVKTSDGKNFIYRQTERDHPPEQSQPNELPPSEDYDIIYEVRNSVGKISRLLASNRTGKLLIQTDNNAPTNDPIQRITSTTDNLTDKWTLAKQHQRSTTGETIYIYTTRNGDLFLTSASGNFFYQQSPNDEIASLFRAKEELPEITSEFRPYTEGSEILPDVSAYLNPDEINPFFSFQYNRSMQRFRLVIAPIPEGVSRAKISKLELSDELSYILGFHKRELLGGELAKYSPDPTAGARQLYVYAPNLVENSMVGDKNVPLLRIINVEGRQGDAAESIYSTEHHIRLMSKRFSEISIEIRTATGSFVNFHWGNCLVTLHFRRNFF